MPASKLVGPIVVGILLVLGGLYLRTDGSSTATFMGTAFVVVGVLSVLLNLALLLAARRR